MTGAAFAGLLRFDASRSQNVDGTCDSIIHATVIVAHVRLARARWFVFELSDSRYTKIPAQRAERGFISETRLSHAETECAARSRRETHESPSCQSVHADSRWLGRKRRDFSLKSG
jgi:hypothetical protein